MFSRYHGYMAFAKRKKEIAMVKMTFTALQQQIRVLAINTDSVSLYVCFFCFIKVHVHYRSTTQSMPK